MTSVAQTVTGYSGWSNCETWLINLWLVNDEGYYAQLHHILRAYSYVQD